MKNLILRDGNSFLGGFEDFFRPWFSERSELRTDIKETDKEYVLEMELAGFAKDAIDISFDDGYITVSASKSEENNEENGKYIRRERRTGSVSRTFYAGDIDEDQVRASYADGILTISYPKEPKGKAEKKRIAIE